MNRLKIKKLLTTVLAVTFFSNGMSTAALGVTNKNKLSQNNVPKVLEGEFEKGKGATWEIDKDIDTESDGMVSVIVEFVSEPLANSGQTTFSFGESKVDRDHRLFEDYLSKLPSTFSSGDAPSITHSYKEVFNGVALKIKGSDVEGLLKSGVVKMIHNDYEVTVEPPVEEVTTYTTGEIAPFMMDSLPKLGVTELHKEGIDGEGIKVGVLDTGIDYNHPDLTNAYEGFRAEDGDVKGQDINSTLGWDFIDNDADPMETTYNDWLESGLPEYNGSNSYYTAHGTHVSGTIAGTADNEESEFAVLGIAPNVELYGYRVLGKYGSGATSGIIAAIEKSVTDGMDVINMSLGSSGTSGPYDPMVTAVNNATKAGVVTVISNGNAGPNSFTVGTPGTAQLPIAVGASNVDININTYSLNIGGLEIASSLVGPSYKDSMDDLLDEELEIVYCGLGYESDFEGKDLTGKIAFVDRGTLTFLDKAKNATNAGAIALIVANNTTESEIPFLGEDDWASIIGISMEDGAALKEVLDNKVTMSSTGIKVVPGDEVTSFSSVGPVKQTYEIRPDLVAPGSNVFSTVPEYYVNTGDDEEDYSIAYRRMSGTSMSAPHIAGIAALILQENPEYSPIEVKLALMNTSELIDGPNGEEYSVHEIGAGRVNAYEAVHDNITFSANYETSAGIDYEPIDNVTGMLSFGKFIAKDEGTIEKTIPVTVTNNSNEAKTYNIDVTYSESVRATDAVENGLSLNIEENSITVPAGGSVTFDASLYAERTVGFGNYEGFIKFTDASNSNSTYQMPFAASILKDGFASLRYPTVYGGTAEGISAITSSDIFMRHWATHYSVEDISILVQLNEEIKAISTYVVDPETKERLGFAGRQTLEWAPSGVEFLLESFASSGVVKKIVDGKVSHMEYPLQTGVYLLEVVGEEMDGNEFSEYLPMGIVNDTKGDEVSYNMNTGIVEATEDLYTDETWYDGNDYNALWIRAKVYNDILNTLKTEYGMENFKQNELNSLLAFGTGRDGSSTQIGNMTKGDDELLIAGIEKADIEDGFYRVELEYINAGKIMKKPEAITFVKPGKSYLEVTSNTEKIKKDSTLNTTVNIYNAENVTKGTFSIKNFGDAIYDNVKITPTEELVALCGDNITADIEYSKVEEMWESYEQYTVTFEIESDDENFEGIVGDIELFNIDYEVVGFEGIGEDLMQTNNFMYESFEGIEGEFFNINNEVVDVMAGTIYNNIDIEYDRTLIYGEATSPMRRMEAGRVYAVDPSGKVYDADITGSDKWLGTANLFLFNDLPVIEGDYKVVLEMPGCFDTITYIPGSKINENGEMVGNSFGATSVSIVPSLRGVAGDVNGDGAIDIVDAAEIAKVYETGIEHFSLGDSEGNNLVTDITQDGAVNYYDMYILLNNYLMQDLSRSDSKVPEEYINGRDIIDILESCGYFDEVPYMDIALNIDSEQSRVGDKVTLSVTPPPDTEGVPFEYEFAVREKNDSDWTIIGERSVSTSIDWTSEAAGIYEFRTRVFLDQIEYVWQDNAIHTVIPNDVVSDKGLLEAVIDYADEAEADGSLEGVVPAVVQEFRAALAEAKEILANTSATQAEVDAVANRLLNAIWMLEFKGGDKETLKSNIDIAELLNLKDYTADSWANLQQVLAEAKVVYADENALEADIEEANKNLEAAIKALVINNVDKAKLEDLANKINSLKAEEYIASTWAAMQEKLDAANVLLANENASQEEIDTAYNELLRAYLGLRLKPSKDKLEGLINKVEALNKEAYTVSSWGAVETALSRAKTVMNNEEATVDEIEVAEKDLENAIAKLVASSNNNNNANNESSNSGNANSGNSNSNQQTGSLPKTGAASSVIAITLGALLAGAGTIIRKKRDEE